MIGDRVSGKDIVVGRARQFVCPSVRLFLLHLLNKLTFDIDFSCIWVMTIAHRD